MPKASSAFRDAVEVSLGIQEGNVEVIGAVVRVHQYPPNKKTGEQGDPFPCVQLEFARLDDDFNRLDEDPVKVEYGIGKLDRFHPGIAKGPNDDDPEDAGDEVDTEGNCIYVSDPGSRLNRKCKWMVFVQHLEQAGFKPEILGNGYMPDLVGLKGHVKTITLPKIAGSDKEPTVLVFDRIVQFPYEKRTKKSAEDKGDDVEAVAREAIAKIMAEKAGQELDWKKFQVLFQTTLMRNRVPNKLHRPALDLLKNNENWLFKVADELGFLVDPELATISFPAA